MRTMLRYLSVALLCSTWGFWPLGAHATPITPQLLSVALELWQAIPSVQPPVGSASGSVSLSGNPSLHTLSQSFSGSAIAAASVDIDRFTQTSANSSVSWTYVFRIDQPGLNQILLDFNYGVGTSVYSHFNANSRATATVSGLLAKADIASFHQMITWSSLTRSGNCSTSAFGTCGPTARSAVSAASQYLNYSPGYPVGTLITVSGALLGDAFGHTGAGSAESSALASATFSITAIPEPSTLSLILGSILALLVAIRYHGRLKCGVRRHRGPMTRNAQEAPRA